MLEKLETKKDMYQQLRNQYPDQAVRLDDWYDKELTFSSNAIEGNTLTRDETAIVIEQGVTIGGKSLKDHNEAKDHYEAMKFIRDYVPRDQSINEKFICDIHHLVTRTTISDAGFYSKHRRRVTGSNFIFPNPVKLPELMEGFGRELEAINGDQQDAFDAHLRLVTIHPFSDGNGRTARLLMNAILLRGGYCPMNILPEQRKDYIDAIRLFQDHGQKDAYNNFLTKRLDVTLNDSIQFLDPEAPPLRDVGLSGTVSRHKG